MTVLATRIAGLSEVVFAALMAVFALSLPAHPSGGESRALLMLVVQSGLALLAAIGLFRLKWWAWLVALVVIVLVFAPIGITIYGAWRAGIGVGITMPADALRLITVGWVAQLVVAICFVIARGKRPPTPGTP